MRRIYSWFYTKLAITGVETDDKVYFLTDNEALAIHKRERFAVMLSAFIGAMGVILLYIPVYIFPSYFTDTRVELLGYAVKLPLRFFILSTVLVAIELFLLVILNIWCAHEIATATGFLNHDNKMKPERKNLLLDIGLEKKNKAILKYGIDPLLGLNKWLFLLFNLLFLMKATLTNLFARFFIQRVMGRYAIRAVQDMAGIPIFSFWNAYGTYLILKECRVVIFGQKLIEEFFEILRTNQEIKEVDPFLLADTMQFIAVSKRDFHQNHYVLTQALFEHYDVKKRTGAWNEVEYIDRLSKKDPKEQSFHVLIIIFGILLDGNISKREIKRMESLRRKMYFPYHKKEIMSLNSDFMQGLGIDKLIRTHLMM